jgi:transposase
VEARFANMPRCLIGMEACVGAHHPSRRLKALGHDARLMPAKVRAALRPPVHVDRKMCSQSTFASPSFARRESEYVHRCNPVRGMKR